MLCCHKLWVHALPATYWHDPMLCLPVPWVPWVLSSSVWVLPLLPEEGGGNPLLEIAGPALVALAYQAQLHAFQPIAHPPLGSYRGGERVPLA